jgi:hypothetical protein
MVKDAILEKRGRVYCINTVAVPSRPDDLTMSFGSGTVGILLVARMNRRFGWVSALIVRI